MATAAGAAPALEVLSAELAALRSRMDAVSLAIHARPELKFAEFHAQKQLAGWLAESGFAVHLAAGGVETAFLAAGCTEALAMG